MKFLIAGLGNIGSEYANTRHNIGFKVLDHLAGEKSFPEKRYGFITEIKYKARIYVLLKPNTYVNRSGNAVHYWLKKLKLSEENLLVVVDDISLPFGILRLRAKGSDGGHNGLSHINQILGHNEYARLRFGIGNDYPPGQQVEYVLGKWTEEESKTLPDHIISAAEIVKSFGFLGVERTMNFYNKRKA